MPRLGVFLAGALDFERVARLRISTGGATRRFSLIFPPRGRTWTLRLHGSRRECASQCDCRHTTPLPAQPVDAEPASLARAGRPSLGRPAVFSQQPAPMTPHMYPTSHAVSSSVPGYPGEPLSRWGVPTDLTSVGSPRTRGHLGRGARVARPRGAASRTRIRHADTPVGAGTRGRSGHRVIVRASHGTTIEATPAKKPSTYAARSAAGCQHDPSMAASRISLSVASVMPSI